MTDGKENLKEEQDLLARLTVYVTETARTLQSVAEVIEDPELHERISGLRIQTQNTLEWTVNRFGEVQKRLREDNDSASE